MTMIDRAVNESNADADRLYATGYSNGGGGTWTLLSRYPRRFSAAIAVAALAYVNNVRMHQRQAAVDRVSRQLRECYGPLLALIGATHMASEAFLREHRPPIGMRRHLRRSSDSQDPVAVAYRLWLSEVLMPRNREMVAVILKSADLLEEDEIPPCLLIAPHDVV